MKNLSTNPPPNVSDPIIVHKIVEFYKNIYSLNKRLPKNEKLGVGNKIENIGLNCLKLSIEAALSPKDKKFAILNDLKIQIEMLKHLVRLINELGIIKINSYLELQAQLQEISKMTAGWINYLGKREPA